ncbi:hypothetical protein KR222_007260, partial [Zaprionus bogoriensis]
NDTNQYNTRNNSLKMMSGVVNGSSNLSLLNFHKHENHKKSLHPGKELLFFADEVVNDIFEVIKGKEKTYQNKVSSSECQFKKPKPDDDMDPRLKAWNNMMKERKLLQHRIQLRTGKRAEDVLFNRHATVDELAKQTIMRLLDTSERFDGYSPDHVPGILKMRQDPATCQEIRELHATDPKLKKYEFIGLPEVTQVELAETLNPNESQWQRSKALEARMEQDKEQIKRVLEYCPEMEHLQVAPSFTPVSIPLVDTKLLYKEAMLNVSPITSETVETEEEPRYAESAVEITESTDLELDGNLIKVNGCIYSFGNLAGSMVGDITLEFQCDPYQRVRKTIVQLENVGNKFIQLKWQQNPLYNKELIQQVSNTREFLFDTQPFVLEPKQKRTIDIMFMPTYVGIKKQSWSLKMQRSPFCGQRRMIVRLKGVCTPPQAYNRRLKLERQRVIDKRTRQVTDRLAKMHAELAPLVRPSHLLCPYDRPLDERETFAAQNPGFKCDRYADLEALKDMYALVKKPRQPPWDYSIQTVRQCIYHHEPIHREALQTMLMDLLEPMRCSTMETFEIIGSKAMLERSRFLFVRGIVCSAIEEWEVLADTLEERFYKAELQRYIENEIVEEGEEALEAKTVRDEEYLDWVLFKRVIGCKYFRDSLYIQTYSILCDAAENLVSAIESTIN